MHFQAQLSLLGDARLRICQYGGVRTSIRAIPGLHVPSRELHIVEAMGPCKPQAFYRHNLQKRVNMAGAISRAAVRAGTPAAVRARIGASASLRVIVQGIIPLVALAS